LLGFNRRVLSVHRGSELQISVATHAWRYLLIMTTSAVQARGGPRTRRSAAESAATLIEEAGAEIVRFQEASNTVDEIAAAILALHRTDLPCMTLLLFGGAATVQQLAAGLRVPLNVLRDVVIRLEMAGYARRVRGPDGSQIELTPHAREWIDRIWEPLRHHGNEMLARFSRAELSVIGRCLRAARAVQEQHIADLRRWLDAPAASRRSHARGGLSPAALRRVQVFIEANIDRSIRTADLADRAGLSVHHFGRAFRTSTGLTPRAFIARRRIECARALLDDTHQPLAHVAAATGFATQSHLTTAFRRATGFTPAAYRRGRRGLTAPAR
jgi:AraC family transcriptional regulator